MQIKEINIIGFGKLENYKLDFSSGVNQVYQNNGYGKTTLMAFIKAMLYGFSKTNRTKRLLYTPWSKGTFGGSMTIVHNGEEYRIERTFGASPSQDTVKVYNLATLKQLEKENVGMFFLQIDEDSFENTTFIDENMLNGKTNSTLIAKLTQLNQTQQEDITNYDRAVKMLEDKKKFYENARGKGALFEAEQNLLQTNRQMERAQRAQSQSEELAKQIALEQQKEQQLRQDIAQLDEQIIRASEHQGSQEARKAYDALCQKQSQLENDLKLQLCAFPQGVPSEQTLKHYSDNVIELQSTQKQAQEEQEKIDQLQSDLYAIENYDNNKKIANRVIEHFKKAHKSQKIGYISFEIMAIVGTICGIITNYLPLIIGGCCAVAIIPFIIKFGIKLDKKNNQTILIHNLQGIWQNYSFSTLEEYDAFLLETKAKINSYNQIKQKLDFYNQKTQNLTDKLQENFNMINTQVDEPYDQALEKVKTQVYGITLLQNNLKSIKEQISFFNLPEQNAGDLNLSELKAKKQLAQTTLEGVKAEIINLINEKDEQENIAEEYLNAEHNAQILNEQIAEMQAQNNKLSYALDYLTRAKEQLGAKYITPTQNELNKLASQFEDIKKLMPLRIKNDLTVMYEEASELREENTLSTGLRHSVNLLLRFALAKTIYGQNDICLFLDDPFTSLDASNLKTLKQITSSLAQNNQIIYLTCSKERTFN